MIALYNQFKDRRADFEILAFHDNTSKTFEELDPKLEKLQSEGKTLLVATHDLSCVAACFSHTLLLNRRLVASGPPNEIFTPEILSEAYAEHLLLLPTEGGVYVGHHGHG